MSIDLDRARTFLATHGRVLDRRRFEAIVSGSDSARRAIVSGLDLYGNADGGYGWGLEPDFRAKESQPQGAQHALEALMDAGNEASPHLNALLDWLQSVALPDGGLPFALPVQDREGCAPLFLEADQEESSLQATSINAAHAYRLARRDRSLIDHPWLITATRYCLGAIGQMSKAPMAYILAYSLRFLDSAADTQPEAVELLGHLARFIPSDGVIPVAGGKDGEAVHPLEYSPEPDRPLREHIDPAAVIEDLHRTERGQQADGGWEVDFDSYSPAAALEWRGYATVKAISALRLNGWC
jgi:hypothetical protein